METTEVDDVKKSSKRNIAPAKVSDWVKPSFTDFSKSTSASSSILHTKSTTDTYHCQKRKEHSLPVETCKSKRKKNKPLPIDESYKPSKQNHNLTEPWVDNYKPKTQNELATHRKKIEEVEAWLKGHMFQKHPKQGGSILLLTGPPGCGKSATLDIVAKDLAIQVQEWINPVPLDFKKDGDQDAFHHEPHFQMLPYQSQPAVFQEFLLRASKYARLQMVGECMGNDKRLILVEDMPNHFYYDPSSLHEILRRFVRTGRCPLVFIISDSFSGASNQRSLFPKEIHEELCITNISFNPVAPTIMMKVLNRITAIEANKNGEKFDAPDKASLELICKGCSGDIRSAINSLQFFSLKDYSSEEKFWSQRKGNSTLKCDTLCKVKKKTKSHSPLENEKVQPIGGRDASIFLFHALGKILYCKREPTTESDFPQLPVHLSEYKRAPLLVQHEDVVEKSHMPGDLFNLYLHQNYIDFFSDIDDLVRASEYLSIADFICNNWDTRPVLRTYSASVATRGVMHSNRARAFAQSKGRMGFRPLHKPQWFFINQKFQENCIAAKSLFSSFCLPPLCLQTELLPYLAMLTNPMRNQAQITFIQDVGRLPLTKRFGRLKLETLTDDATIQVLDSDDEGAFAEIQSTKVLLQTEKTKINEENEPDELRLTSSQSSGHELPGSQPQPIAAQVIMAEDDFNIEEYDSD
nr:cell cycle checkpoint protein RAD17 isoform X1 [Pogona vitticeps]XP_020645937.1 cell cycle checkpoint protein RAD17 isoform X1 [Pogona vitticeps]XP_020645938.1 cell cycle checkpoint protein RAD17 isoform X1 [Pogona vitticeps]XP_020645939.1 cell cycle checkpoint protein RAD17 isoform X1 [Pogona vitticeps]XP_020645940.1 cell cycle checkpoint protein RAD17 isoform X1 [Pogona vitticeps]